MQGVHVFERHAKTVIDLESFVEQDHLLRKIDRVLDTAFVRDSTAACYADGLGRPSVDPEVYFRMQLVGLPLWYLFGTATLRRRPLPSRLPLVLPSVAGGLGAGPFFAHADSRPPGGGGSWRAYSARSSRSAGRRVWSTRNVA